MFAGRVDTDDSVRFESFAAREALDSATSKSFQMANRLDFFAYFFHLRKKVREKSKSFGNISNSCDSQLQTTNFIKGFPNFSIASKNRIDSGLIFSYNTCH